MSRKQKRKARGIAARRAKANKPSGGLTRKDTRGRTHLLVERDGGGRATNVKLERPIFEERWQNDVVSAAASTAHGLFETELSQRRAIELGLSAMAGASKIIDGALSLAGEQPLACHAGCAHCCYQAVGVSVPEVLAIYWHLKETSSAQSFESRLDRVRQADTKTRGLSDAERLSPEYPCPFLDDERCSIYEVRPLACRGKNSLDAEACKSSLHDARVREQFLAGTFAVPCFTQPVRAFHAVAAGVQLALHELHGLWMLPLELTAAFRILADAPDETSEAWLSGKDAFVAARGGDAGASPFIATLVGRQQSGA